MTLYVFDGAGPFDLAAAKAAGGIAVTVYIVGTPGGMPHADQARVNAARAAGLGVLPNWERQADYFGTCTVTDAQAAGVEALAACRALGFPDDGTIGCAFSFDFDVPVSRFGEMGSKVRAVTAGLAGHYKTMIYGQQALIDWLATHGYISGKSWLMMSTFNQTYTPRSPNVCMVQEHDADGNWLSSPVPGTDVNTITDPGAVHAWWPNNSPYATQGDAPMTPAEIQSVADAVWAKAFSGTTTGADGKPVVSPQHSAAEWLANTNLGERDDATSTQLADVKAAIVALASAVAKLQAGTAPPVVLVPSGTITLTPQP